ncbi:unnamed protein product [Pleuronectes platessa]|uniref:Uncharacterized protein n=1 Tax=Pleuronectes platessa TaxID=8262 RepID=A0A9N7VSI0_PLEPL|nr:unnamed protein product [Pleuronectes platessa]
MSGSNFAKGMVYGALETTTHQSSAPLHCGILHACGRASDSHATAPFSASWQGDWESACSQNILECAPLSLEYGEARAQRVLHLQHASHCTGPHCPSVPSHFKQSISQQWLIAALARWAAAGCVQPADSAATGSQQEAHFDNGSSSPPPPPPPQPPLSRSAWASSSAGSSKSVSKPSKAVNDVII